MGDVHAGDAPEGLIDPTDSWGTLGAHVVAERGARGAHVGGCNCSESLLLFSPPRARILQGVPQSESVAIKAVFAASLAGVPYR